MSGGRPNKPLFELLRDGPDQPAPTAAHPDPAGPTTRPRVRTLQVPVSTIAISVALVLGLVLLAWVGGHKFGLEAGRREMARASTPNALADLVINDPIAEPTTRVQPAVTTDIPGEPAVAAEPAVPEGEIIASTGMLLDDPREPFMNYLVLATLDEGSAADAVQFLATRGIEAIAVPNADGASYRLIALDAPIPSGQMRDHAVSRAELERRVALAGREWLRDHRGASDFSRPLWALHEP